MNNNLKIKRNHFWLKHFLFAFISGASMDPARSLAPAIVSEVLANPWLYWTAIFIGTSMVAALYRKKFH